MDVFQKCRDYQQARDLRTADLYSYYRPIASAQDPEVTMADGRRLVMLGSNNYLGLTNHPEVKEAAATALARYGTGCAGSRLLNGSLDLHEQLEAKLATFMRREAAVTFSTGFQVNLGTLSCLLGRHDVAILDALDHACILDGCRLGFGKIWKFPHNDMAGLEKKLAAVPEGQGRLVVVDGVYSMEGDVAPLVEIAALSKRFGARLMVDDAHGIGVLGACGRGTAEHFGVEADVDLVMGTFSKSLAAIGGFVAGDAGVIDYVRHTARSAVFSAALPPASAAAALKALEIVEREPERRKQLWETTAYMKRELAALGLDTGNSESPVIPVVVGDDVRALQAVRRLHDEGVFVNCVISPGVPEGRAMLRTSYMATHQRAHLDRALDAIGRVTRELGLR